RSFPAALPRKTIRRSGERPPKNLSTHYIMRRIILRMAALPCMEWQSSGGVAIAIGQQHQEGRQRKAPDAHDGIQQCRQRATYCKYENSLSHASQSRMDRGLL